MEEIMVMVVTPLEGMAKITLITAIQVLVLTVVHPVTLAMLVVTGIMATQAAVLAIRMGMVIHPIPALVDKHPTAIVVTATAALMGLTL